MVAVAYFLVAALSVTVVNGALGRHMRTFRHRRAVLSSSEDALFSGHPTELHARDDCEPADPLNTLTDRLNTLLNSSGPGYILPLCPSVQYFIQAPILFAAQDQEISTVGYPTGDERATLVVAGPVANGQGNGDCTAV
ncbi:hypothetical protein NUW54_g1844 [Trametes sanguinea]|uniref:Uncharacterized protein n=1 Tax=Trametes sanguinea TaxID=158606 RepID=A0ACC1Q579_9APHY|nr:hypothetical protein NUW54_g1844 [Trametes sanguinea]